MHKRSLSDWLVEAACDEHLLDIAVRASLQGVNLDPVPIDIAIENPANRDAIARALLALAKEFEHEV